MNVCFLPAFLLVIMVFSDLLFCHNYVQPLSNDRHTRAWIYVDLTLSMFTKRF